MPKNNKPSCLNDYRPVALTSIVMEVFERLVKSHICSSILVTLDPLQFANRSTDDAISHILHSSLTHIRPRPKLFTLRLDSRFPHRQTSSGESRPVHLKLHHPESRSSTGLCPESPALLSLHTWLRVLSQLHIYYQICWWYCGSGPHFQQWWDRILGWGRETYIMVPGQLSAVSLNVSKTKELIVDFRKRHLRPYTPLMISGTPVERVSSFKYLGVNISEDLTWTTHIQTQVKKARQRLYHLRQLRKFRVSPTILKTFYSGTIESVLTQCISVWYGNSSSQDCKALQRVVRLAERISGSTLPSLQDIYLKRCRSRAVKIIKDSNYPSNCLFTLLPSGKRFRSPMAKTERLRRSFFPQAIRLLNSNSAS